MQGLPASGKTTWAKEYCKNNKDFVRINRDDLREMIGNYSHHHEEMIREMEYEDAIIALEVGYSVIIDGINFSQTTINKWKETAEKLGHKFEIKYMHCTLETCILRDAIRPKPVGDDVIKGIYNQYLNIAKQ